MLMTSKFIVRLRCVDFLIDIECVIFVCLLIVSQFVLFLHTHVVVFYMYVLFSYQATISINALTYSKLAVLMYDACESSTEALQQGRF